MSPYNYSFNNPVMFNDPSGADPTDGDEPRLPKGVRNGGVAGGHTIGNPNAGTTSSVQPSKENKAEARSEEKYGWTFLKLEQKGDTVDVKIDTYYENVTETIFGKKYGFGAATLILGSDKHWHVVPKEWLTKPLNSAGSPKEVFQMVNSWKLGDEYMHAYKTAEGFRRLGENAQAGFMIGAGIGELTNFRKNPVKINLSGKLALRAAYEKEVSGLASLADKMKEAGNSSEEIARTLHGMRRELGIKYKSLTPNKLLQQIYQRNIQKYGDKLGPSIEFLRNKGKSWDDIINSATRSGGKDLKF